MKSDKIKSIADKYGYESQSRQLVEEMAELTQAINKRWRHVNSSHAQSVEEYLNGLKACVDDISQEIADVEICLEQVKYLLECEPDVDAYRDIKIERQIQRMN